ncbi:hypothetical protein [Ottowia oryzae]|uniref:hypothetical protein n=1 Tax=Ottowia oryzae TaxID=2109914 RepID=UPI000F4EB2AD|nr:hypothetical protein [Ottowia oryzae]
MTESAEDLAGTLDAVAQALLTLTAQLEARGIIDGPGLCAAWRARRAPADASGAHAAALLRTMGQLANGLDQARATRQSRGR